MICSMSHLSGSSISVAASRIELSKTSEKSEGRDGGENGVSGSFSNGGVGTAVIVRRNEEEVEVDLRDLESEFRSNSDRSSYRSEFGLDSTRGARLR